MYVGIRINLLSGPHAQTIQNNRQIIPLGATLTVIQVTSYICNTFQTSFVLDLVALSCFGLKLHIMVIMKALLLLYNIESSTHQFWLQ